MRTRVELGRRPCCRPPGLLGLGVGQTGAPAAPPLARDSRVGADRAWPGTAPFPAQAKRHRVLAIAGSGLDPRAAAPGMP